MLFNNGHADGKAVKRFGVGFLISQVLLVQHGFCSLFFTETDLGLFFELVLFFDALTKFSTY